MACLTIRRSEVSHCCVTFSPCVFGPSSDLYKVEIDVPSSLNAASVRFRWKQENFENAFEFWALDDVRVSTVV